MIKPLAIDGQVNNDHEKADGNLNRASEATGIDYRNEIVLNKAAAVS